MRGARRPAASAGLSSRILACLRDRAAPASSAWLAERFLRLSAGSEEIATRLLEPALRGVATYREGIGWSAAARAGGILAARRVAVAWDETPEEGGIPRPAFTPVDAGEWDPDQGLEGAVVIAGDPRVEGPWLRRWLRSRRMASPDRVVSLRAAVSGAVRLPRLAGLERIAFALDVVWLDSDRAEETSRAIADCVRAADARRGGPEGPGAPGEGSPGLPGGITRGQLALLPESPGVYRFFDRQGKLLYVGKSANLRRRVASYFTPSAARRPRRFYGRIHTLETQATATELEALLREARQIRRRAPSGNAQIQVHERGSGYGSGRAFALLLAGRGGRVTAVFVRDGRYLGHAGIGPRGGGRRGAIRLIGLALGLGECPGIDVDRPKGSGGAGGGDPESRLLASWMSRHAGQASRLDLDMFATQADAARGLSAAAADLIARCGPTVFR